MKALTPEVGRGKRQIRELSNLQQKANTILKAYRVEGFLEYSYEYQPQIKKRRARYQITEVIHQQAALKQTQKTFGWRVYVTNAPLNQLSFEQAALTVRDAWIQEKLGVRVIQMQKVCPQKVCNHHPKAIATPTVSMRHFSDWCDRQPNYRYGG